MINCQAKNLCKIVDIFHWYLQKPQRCVEINQQKH